MVDSWIGRTIGKYEIVELLGRGGMAEVYKANQKNLDRHVAIKMMHAFLAEEKDFLKRFEREARAMASLNHNGIIDVYDFDVHNHTYYIVMEYVSGGTLKTKLEEMAARDQKLPLSQSVKIILEIADALAYAHARGMVHRDIKPGNIMFNEQGRAVLTDFGIAKILSGPSFTATGAMMGTPAYMSPEQGMGQGGDEKRSDIYSLGVLFFQMATGSLPYDADTPLAIVMKHLNEPVPSVVELNPTLPDNIQQIINKAMAKDPAERYETAHDFARALRTAVQTSTDNLALAQALPANLLEDQPTPQPATTLPGPTASDATVHSPAPEKPAETAVSWQPIVPTTVVDETKVAAAPSPPAAKEKKRPAWLIPVGAALLLIVALAVIGGGALALRGGDSTPTPPLAAVVEPTATATDAPATEIPVVDTATPEPDTAATSAALAVDATPEETPSPTAPPSPSPTSTATPTPDLTATSLASCTENITLVNSYTYQNQNFDSAPVGVTFPINFILRNNGTCTLPAGLTFGYQSGETFGHDGTLTMAEALAPEDEVTLTTSFIAPDSAGTYEATWQLFNEAGAPIGDPIEFEVIIYIPATATPVPPTATVGPTPTPTGEVVAVGFNIFPNNGCEYPGGGSEWRCAMLITPFGGGGGPYTIWVFDGANGQPVRYGPGGNVTHYITSRRCSPWNHEIKVQDEVTGDSLSQTYYIDPTQLSSFPGGGCTE